ncbi:MAG TPA: PAS domain S-box protein [Chitinophagaceae bacterium]
MSDILKILILEDSDKDTQVIKDLLQVKEQSCEFKVVEEKEPFEQALLEFRPHVVLFCNVLPAFTAQYALQIVKQILPYAPFILITGTVSEEFAAAIIKAGAADYLLKDRMTRLPMAIQSALKQKLTEIKKEKAEENNRFQAKLLNTIGQAVVATDMNGIINFWNKAAEEIYGWTEGEAIGKNVIDLLPATQLKEQAIEIMENLSTGERWAGEFLVQGKDGKVFPVFVTDSPICDANNKTIGVIGISSDITERKKIEQQLVMSTQQLAVIYNTVADVIFLLSVEDNERFKFISVNHTFLEATGLAANQVIDKYADEIIPAPSWNIALAHYRKAIVTKSTVQWEEVSEYPSGTKTGVVNVTPVFDEKGNCIRLVGSVHDITESKKAEEALKESENYLRTIIQTEPECIKLLNKKGELEEMNPAGLAMIEANSLEEIKGNSILGLINEPYRDAFTQLTEDVFAGKSGQLIFQVTGFKGTQRWLETHAVPLKDANGKIISLLGVTRDITERKKTEEELSNTNEELHYLSSHLQNVREEERMQIARDIHDELGQQLTGLKLEMSHLIKKMNITDKLLQQKAEGIISLIDDTVNSVRTISTNLRPSILDDIGLIAALEWLSEEIDKRSGIQIKFEATMPEPDLPTATATALFRIYQEALTNAVRHSEARHINASLSKKDNNIILVIKDDGLGFDTSMKDNKKAVGLMGMKERIFILNGHYELNSALGKGTQIKISIPF